MRLQLHGEFEFRHWRGTQLISKQKIRNALTNQGRNDLLDGYLGNGGVAGSGWFIGLIDNAGYVAINVADTLAAHVGWIELSNYPGGRQPWVVGSATGLQITSSADTIFVFHAPGTVRGFLIASENAGNNGVL